MTDTDQLRKEFTDADSTERLAADFSQGSVREWQEEEVEQERLRNDTSASGSAHVTEYPFEPVLKLRLRVETLEHYQGLPPLKKATPGSVGIDLFSANYDTLLLNSIGATVIVPTGIKIELPKGYEAQIRPRSGLAAKEGLTILNAPGTIDSDYRGEIKVILTKLTTGKFQVERGMRIAQMVIAPVVFPTIEYVDSVNDTSRGEAGFGSSGVKL